MYQVLLFIGTDPVSVANAKTLPGHIRPLSCPRHNDPKKLTPYE